MARKKSITLSITRFIQIAYIVRLLTGMGPMEIIAAIRAGNTKDTMWALAEQTFARLEAEGISIAVEGGFMVILTEYFRKAMRNKQLLRLGPFKVTV